MDHLSIVPALAPPAAELRPLSARGSDPKDAAARLGAALAAAFLVGGRRAAPPYASVWLGECGLMYLAPAREMMWPLAPTGFSLPGNIPEPPDHIGFQLNLLAEPADRHRVGQDVRVVPDTFIFEHPLAWLLQFVAAFTKPPRSAALRPARRGRARVSV